MILFFSKLLRNKKLNIIAKNNIKKLILVASVFLLSLFVSSASYADTSAQQNKLQKKIRKYIKLKIS